MIDYAAAQRRVTAYRSRLTRLKNTKNLQGIIDLWAEMQAEFDDRDWPLPDQWRLWERAAEDARLELHRRQQG